ncbi:MAG TPA: tyrosine-type recombinase/integrase [Mycobacteriales bacterium]|nr:tyrosine-type recombinase/integrase [Mycobacteriales bacterium]
MSERLEDLAASWRRDLRAADKADRTIELYGQSVRFFSDWLIANDRPTTADQLTKHAIAGWLADLRDKGQSGNTLSTRYRGLKRFCRWLVAEGELVDDPMAGLEKPKGTAKPVDVLTDDEIERLFKVTGGAEFADRRDHAILRVLFDCGVRISEVSELRLEDVDLTDHDVLHVIGKGRKPRTVPFGAKTGRALDRYRRVRGAHRFADDPKFFLTQRGGMSRDGIDDMLRSRALQASVDNLHAHRFRHTAAHRWLAAGGQERDLMRLMGWSSDAMLSHYGSSAADERARDAFRRMKLGDRL